MKIHYKLIIASILWGGFISFGLFVLYDFEYTPGLEGKAPNVWPSQSNIQKQAGKYHLVMCVHPHCPCTRASLYELSHIMRYTNTLTATLLFVQPRSFDREWVKTDLWSAAKEIPRVFPLIDYEGTESRLFGATTSGQVLLFNNDGKLLFNGGITESRGHIGDSFGKNRVLSLVSEHSDEVSSSPYFGCPLFCN